MTHDFRRVFSTWGQTHKEINTINILTALGGSFGEKMANDSQKGSNDPRINLDIDDARKSINDSSQQNGIKIANFPKVTQSKTKTKIETTQNKFRRLTTFIFGSSTDSLTMLSNDMKSKSNDEEGNSTINTSISNVEPAKIKTEKNCFSA